MTRFPRAASAALCLSLLIALCVEASPLPQQQQPSNASGADRKSKKKEKRSRKSSSGSGKTAPAPVQSTDGAGEETIISADHQSKDGDTYFYEGYVNATQGDYRLQADRANLNTATSDLVAEGSVIFDQGPNQRVTAKRAELNWQSKLGTFWDTTGFTDRTQTGEYVFFTAARVEKTGEDTYELYDAVVTACEDVIPKWTFSARRAELKMGDRVILHNAVFRIKTLPALVLPYTWIPATRKERKS